MTYEEDEAKASEPRSWRIGYQDDRRRWRPLLSTTVDASARVLRATTPHLSDWSLLKGLSLAPGQARVKVGGSLTLTLRDCSSRPPQEEDELAPLMGSPVQEDELSPIGFECVDEELASLNTVAAVNGVQGGNATFGTVRNGLTEVVFTAPARKPSPDLVAVSLRFNTQEGLTTVVSNVTIFDEAPRAFPSQLSGSFTYSQDFGGPGTGSTKLRLALMGNASFTNRNEEGAYQGSGMVTVMSGFVELPDCDCDVTGGAGPITGSLLLTDSQYSWGFAGDIPLAISCRLLRGSGSCPGDYTVLLSFGSRTTACPGSATTTYTMPDQLMGSASRMCPNSSYQANWNFSGK
jgi:hypothetical protein